MESLRDNIHTHVSLLLLRERSNIIKQYGKVKLPDSNFTIINIRNTMLIKLREYNAKRSR